MNSLKFIVLGGTFALGLTVTACVRSQEGTGEQVGKKVDETIGQIREGAKKVFEDVRGSVERLSVVGRVYARIHWDKALNNSSISVDVSKDGNTTLSGTVPDEKAKAKAELLAGDTVGVQTVVNELTIPPPAK